MKILVIDDEQDICEILQYNLEMEGYEVATANSAEEAITSIYSNKSASRDALPSLILLDVMMGEMSGFQMVRKLKENAETAHIPIIFITALDSEDDMVKGLNIGADDYMTKPLSMKEVKARVKAVLRRTSPPTSLSADLQAHSPMDGQGEAGISLNLISKTATLDGQELMLTKLEFELLALFLQYPNKVFCRNELLERCWPNDVCVLDRTVDVNITRLRRKIGRYGQQIKTRVGYGYIFEQ